MVVGRAVGRAVGLTVGRVVGRDVDVEWARCVGTAATGRCDEGFDVVVALAAVGAAAAVLGACVVVLDTDDPWASVVSEVLGAAHDVTAPTNESANSVATTPRHAAGG